MRSPPSSLALGALIGLARPWPRKAIGLVLGFGAGALISAVSFELAEDGVKIAGALPVAIGLAVGALTYFAASGRVAAMGGGGRSPSVPSSTAYPSRWCSVSAWPAATK